MLLSVSKRFQENFVVTFVLFFAAFVGVLLRLSHGSSVSWAMQTCCPSSSVIFLLMEDLKHQPYSLCLERTKVMSE